jgi:O-antigen ligase
MTAGRAETLDRLAFVVLAGCLGVVQFNLSVAQVLFGVAALLWVAVAVSDRRRPALPAFALPLGVYALLTLISAAVSLDPATSLADCKQLVLFLMVPMIAHLCRGPRAWTSLSVVIACGAIGALLGIVQFTMLGYDHTEKRPEGSLTLYMTYSGVVMLVLCSAAARLLFYREQRIWPGIALPALAVGLAVTFTRNAWVGAMAAIGTLFAIRDRRLLLALPLVAGLFLVTAPDALRSRALSTFDVQDPSNRDRVAMWTIGQRIVVDHPLAGVGPDMVKEVYADYRPAQYVNPTNPHLHNVPIQIAAERGLPALAAWLWFVAVALRDLWRQLRRGPMPALAAAGLSAVIAMLAAGMFEYNFGDSEFLMLLLGLMTLPFAATRTAAVNDQHAR